MDGDTEPSTVSLAKTNTYRSMHHGSETIEMNEITDRDKDDHVPPKTDSEEQNAQSFTEFVKESTFHGVKYIFDEGTIARRY